MLLVWAVFVVVAAFVFVVVVVMCSKGGCRWSENA